VINGIGRWTEDDHAASVRALEATGTADLVERSSSSCTT
jgi:hypothetical protein